MIIAVAGPYSADTEEQRRSNMRRMNAVAAELYSRGHIPLIGINAALPVAEEYAGLQINADKEEAYAVRYHLLMSISLAAISSCDALLLIAESPGALKEADMVAKLGKPVYTSIDQIPAADNRA